MKAFLLLVCVIVAGAQAANFTKEFKACVDAGTWTKAQVTQNCADDPPTDKAGLARRKEFNFCILKSTNVIEVKGSKLIIHPENGAVFAAPGQPGKVIVDVIKKCMPQVKAQPTPEDAALEIEMCFRKSSKVDYDSTCEAFVGMLFP